MEKAYEMENDKKIYHRWLVGYEKEMSYDEFKKRLNVKPKNNGRFINKTEKEILSDVKSILEKGW